MKDETCNKQNNIQRDRVSHKQSLKGRIDKINSGVLSGEDGIFYEVKIFAVGP